MGVRLKWETDKKMPLLTLYLVLLNRKLLNTKVQFRLAALSSSWHPLLLGMQNSIKPGLVTMQASKVPQGRSGQEEENQRF